MLQIRAVQKIPFYVFPEDMAEMTAERVMFYIAALGTSEEPSLEKWKSWIVTYVCLITPGVTKMLDTRLFQPHQVQAGTILEISRLFDEAEEALDNDNVEKSAEITAQLASLKGFPLLPQMASGLNLADANGEWRVKVVTCHFSIMLFLAGKRVSGDNHSQITVSRPKAVKAKAHIEDMVDLLEGSFKMSNVAHFKINDAWAELGALKGVVFPEYVKFESSEASELHNLIWTTMHLLRFSGMSHASIVYHFLQVCPWVHEIPTLRPALAIYAKSVVEAGKVDPKLFPYVKLIYGDKSTFFPRKELEPLIACAVSVLTETNPTLAAYFVRPEFSPIVEAFEQKRAEKEAQGKKRIELNVQQTSFEDDDSTESSSDQEENDKE